MKQIAEFESIRKALFQLLEEVERKRVTGQMSIVIHLNQGRISTATSTQGPLEVKVR